MTTSGTNTTSAFGRGGFSGLVEAPPAALVRAACTVPPAGETSVLIPAAVAAVEVVEVDGKNRGARFGAAGVVEVE